MCEFDFHLEKSIIMIDIYLSYRGVEFRKLNTNVYNFFVEIRELRYLTLGSLDS